MNDATADRTEVMRVLVLADPGMCVRRAEAARERFERDLEGAYGAVSVEIRERFLALDERGALDVDAAWSDDDADAILLLTEMPRRSGGRPLIAELRPERRAAILSLPTIGVLAPRRRLAALFLECVVRLDDQGADREHAGTHAGARWSEPSDGSPPRLRARALVGALRTVVGMVATNTPWTAASKLSSALAAASGAGAFGIFYNSIWSMSAALSTPRLLSIGLLAMVLMVAWLIVRNGLWERPTETDRTTVLLYYNLSTVLTLFLCVLALYTVLVVVILGAGLVIISPDFMSEVIGEPAEFIRYLDIAWLSAAMGVVAGGLGSGFDDEADLRSLTHARREGQRRR